MEKTREKQDHEIVITYHSKPYYYDENLQQPYSVDMEVVLNSDITSDEAILAFVRVLQAATYRIDSDTLHRVAEKYAHEYEVFCLKK